MVNFLRTFLYWLYQYGVLLKTQIERLCILSIVQAGDFQWSSDGGQAANQLCISNSFKRSYIEESPVVPEKHSDIGGSVSHANDGNEAQSLHVIISENSSALPRVSPHELNSQERDSALSRYKEKKKTRRYHCHLSLTILTCQKFGNFISSATPTSKYSIKRGLCS